MTALEKVHVQIGQVKTGAEGQMLTAILGSCIGIGFLWPDRGRYGLAHCLLSKSENPRSGGGGRHVDQAIETLKADLQITPADCRKVRVILAGGANMTMPADTAPERLVGTINAEFALKAIRAAGLRVSHDDLGGMQGRQVSIDCTKGSFEIVSIPRSGG